MRRSTIVLVLLVVSAGAGARHVYPQNLSAVQDGQTFTLAENYIFQEKAATFTLRAGSYVQKFEDSKAIYLIGGDNCLEMSVVPPKNPAAAWSDTWNCGVFLPKDPSKGAAFFAIRRTPEKEHSGSGLVVDSIIKAGYGSFDFPTSKHNDMELRARLVAGPP